MAPEDEAMQAYVDKFGYMPILVTRADYPTLGHLLGAVKSGWSITEDVPEGCDA